MKKKIILLTILTLVNYHIKPDFFTDFSKEFNKGPEGWIKDEKATINRWEKDEEKELKNDADTINKWIKDVDSDIDNDIDKFGNRVNVLGNRILKTIESGIKTAKTVGESDSDIQYDKFMSDNHLTDKNTPYKILGVSRNSSFEDIETAFNKLKNKYRSNEKIFQKLEEAKKEIVHQKPKPKQTRKRSHKKPTTKKRISKKTNNNKKRRKPKKVAIDAKQPTKHRVSI